MSQIFCGKSNLMRGKKVTKVFVAADLSKNSSGYKMMILETGATGSRHQTVSRTGRSEILYVMENKKIVR